MKGEIARRLRDHGVRPSAQRVAVGEYVLSTKDHPSAEHVFSVVRRRFPMLSRATVYNTLNLFARKGLLQQIVVDEGRMLFDPTMEPHHHFLDERTGKVHDIPWEKLDVGRIEALKGFDVKSCSVVLRGHVVEKRSR